MKKPAEKREHKRFRSHEGAFVLQERYFSGRCQIIDISKGGLSIQNLGRFEQRGGPFDVDLFFSEKNFFLKNLSVRCIYDEDADTGPFISLPIRRKGLQFEELHDDQASQLDYFIQNYTVD